MEIYLVGGAVRDALLNLPVKDKDYLVVGGSIKQMLALGYQQVGKDFPVFLHPKTKEEYALARTERKTGKGYLGFDWDVSADVTLEQDLSRRDLTINAIAQDQHGKLQDPFKGQQDLNNRLLRHVSAAFVEDPLRVLRVARFAARFSPQGFRVAAQTLALMTEVSNSGELQYLTPERVWLELDKTLDCAQPQVFFDVLKQCGALGVLVPVNQFSFKQGQLKSGSEAINADISFMPALTQAAKLTSDKVVRFAALLLDLSKMMAVKAPLSADLSQQDRELIAFIEHVSEHLRVPKEHQRVALLVGKYRHDVHQIATLSAEQVLSLFDNIDAWRKPHRLNQLLQTCLVDLHSRLMTKEDINSKIKIINKYFNLAREIEVKPIVDAGFKGVEIKNQIQIKRIKAINKSRQ